MNAVALGHHRVFLGMAAGVGKTFRMLQEGHAEAGAGRDVVIGYLEVHGREETAAQARGLEVLPRRRIEHRGVVLEEMDLPAILGRRPGLCLVDELAHTNAPGLEHAKRWQDVQDLLAAGIDVFSTVNVQHLESLNDLISDLTGTRVRETLPDQVVGQADEVLLVDLTPEELIERLRAGKIYRRERIPEALNGFFRVEGLAALRELALRQVAEDVEVRRLTGDPPHTREPDDARVQTAASQSIGERLLVLVEPTPEAHRVVRRGWRAAQRLQAELDVLWVSAREPTPQEREQVDALRRLTVVLGAHLLVARGTEVAVTVRDVAKAQGTTYVVMGRPRPRTALGRVLRPALHLRLLRVLPDVDLHIVGGLGRQGVTR